MSDYIILTNDFANFNPAFGNALVVVRPGIMSGSGDPANSMKKICVEGDEKNVSVPACMYAAPPYVIPGTGTLRIDSLGADQLTKKANNGGKLLILKGSTFTAKFEVQSPAQQPTSAGPVPDSSPQYSGTGTFITTNINLKAS